MSGGNSLTVPVSYLLETSDTVRTAVIIANGPSLRDVDLRVFGACETFGMNAAYRYWQRIGWRPQNYACLDEVVGLSHADAIRDMIIDNRQGRAAPATFCLRRNLVDALGEAGRDPSVVTFEDLADADPRFFRSPVTTGSHTLLWALSRGFRRVFVIGADASYVEVAPGARRVSDIVLEAGQSSGNPNYFFDDYQQAGDLYHLPNIGDRPHLRSWRVAASAAAELDAEVYNLSPNSRIDAFDFANIDDLIGGRPIRVTSATRHRRGQP